MMVIRLSCYLLIQIPLHMKQEALLSILSAGQRAYTEYSSFSGRPKVE